MRNSITDNDHVTQNNITNNYSKVKGRWKLLGPVGNIKRYKERRKGEKESKRNSRKEGIWRSEQK